MSPRMGRIFMLWVGLLIWSLVLCDGLEIDYSTRIRRCVYQIADNMMQLDSIPRRPQILLKNAGKKL